MNAAVLVLVLGGCNRTEPDLGTPLPAPPAATDAQPVSDSALSTAVQAKYYVDDTLRADRIDVAADNGVIILRGNVASDAVKQRAAELARSVDGVRDVQNHLTIMTAEAAAAAKPAEQTAPAGTTGKTGEELQPAWITTKIQAQYFASAEIKPWNIDVTTASGGVVTLEGLVEDQADKAEAVRIARETEGVTKVEDRLRVKSGEAAAKEGTGAAAAAEAGLTDAWLTSKVQAKYFLDDVVKGRNIDVDTVNGVVTLTGVVGSEAERRQALALARTTDGVRDVTDRLSIDPKLPPRAAARPEGPAGVPSLPRPDPWITMKIQAQYFLDADVKGHRIDVTTRDGVVTLTGSVESEAQKREAEQIAVQTEGVKRVTNRLTARTAGGA